MFSRPRLRHGDAGSLVGALHRTPLQQGDLWAPASEDQMTDRELDEIEASARAARTRWDRDDPDWLAVVLDLAGNRVPHLVEEVRELRSALGRRTGVPATTHRRAGSPQPEDDAALVRPAGYAAQGPSLR